MYLGVIADDFTGGTDIAGFLVQNGLSVTQFIGVPSDDFACNVKADAAIISLKSRSCHVREAVDDSLKALEWLKKQGCEQYYFKYCSTFDSTAKGNIGPVTDALLQALGSNITVVVPSLPINGRTVYNGYLFVLNKLLNESGMRNHPVTPMLDANLLRLMEAQSSGKAANIAFNIMEQGKDVISSYIEELKNQGISYIVPDTLSEGHLDVLGEVVKGMPLVTGGSGLAIGIAKRMVKEYGLSSLHSASAGMPTAGPSVVLSGSASVMTNVQVESYKAFAVSMPVDVHACVTDANAHAKELVGFVAKHLNDKYAPMIYATARPEVLKAVQEKFGAEKSSKAVETVFANVAMLLQKIGCKNFIVAGGETSGAVVQALGVQAFAIGPQIAPGVPWVRAADANIALALKSGNFGMEDFFSEAQGFYS